ncbi:MAG TPA: mandelate racemase/muconate lactonizing enzyme family protein, partial [Rhodospirillaceae bacterium]|nr:mandelate racemase/muconate lactonizing enzyme family protein [Rhodospirillaceae bacterium]
MWLAASPDDLVQEAQDFLKQGFKAMKVRLGKLPLAQNIERVEAVRDTIGPDIKLMADANQGLSVPEAIQLARALAPYDLFWFEEP